MQVAPEQLRRLYNLVQLLNGLEDAERQAKQAGLEKAVRGIKDARNETEHEWNALLNEPNRTEADA